MKLDTPPQPTTQDPMKQSRPAHHRFLQWRKATSLLLLRKWLTWEERKRLLYVEAWIAALGLQFLIGIAILLPVDIYDDSMGTVAMFWFSSAVLTLTLHLGLIQLAVLGFALYRRHWRLAAATTPLSVLPLMLLGWGAVPRTPLPAEGPTLRLMSINLLNSNDHRKAIVGEILEANPDVIAFQEYTPEWRKTLLDRLGEKWPHHIEESQSDSFGAAVFSKVPFSGIDSRIDLGNSGVPAFRAELVHDGKIWVVYNIHNLPPRTLEYVAVQRSQFRDLLERVRAESYPTVVCGDMNWTQYSWYNYVLAANGFQESHDYAGAGLGNTWPVNGTLRYAPVPGFRIDHFYFGNGVTCLTHRTGIGSGSDHRPIIAEFGLLKTAEGTTETRVGSLRR